MKTTLGFVSVGKLFTVIKGKYAGKSLYKISGPEGRMNLCKTLNGRLVRIGGQQQVFAN